MNTYSLLRVMKQFEAMKLQVRYKKWSVIKKPPTVNPAQYKKWNMMRKLPTINPAPEPLQIEDKPVRNSGSSYAMKAYLDRVQSYNKFMSEEKTAFEIGKRHLANMMGRDPETFTQEDIDESIRYLFPSSLYQPDARPMMKPPEQIFPPKKEAEFDETGRPYHFLFYTAMPRFYQTLHDAAKMLTKLNEYEDKIIRGEETNSKNFSAFPLHASTWIEREILEKKFQEQIAENEFNKLKMVVERIAAHPYGSQYAGFIREFCFELTEKHVPHEDQKPEVLEDGRQRIFIPFIRRHTVIASVSVTYPGTGQFLIDDLDLRLFASIQERQAVLYPLVLSNMLKKVDIEARTVQKAANGGDSALAIAIRTGISRALVHFVDTFTRDKLKLAGLLSNEIRVRERKKPGQEGKRRKFTWRKR